jgi:hypothetical protein
MDDLLVFGFTYLVTAAIYAVVALSALGERARSFKAVSPGDLRSTYNSNSPQR